MGNRLFESIIRFLLAMSCLMIFVGSLVALKINWSNWLAIQAFLSGAGVLFLTNIEENSDDVQ